MSRNLSDSQFEQVPMFDPGPQGPSDRNLYFHYTDDVGQYGYGGAGAEWNPLPGQEMHLGTGKAAADRGRSVREGLIGGEEFVEPTPGRVHVARLREPLDNTPEKRLSDPMANVLYNTNPQQYDEAAASKEVSAEARKTSGAFLSESASMERLGARRKIARGLGRGAYYENLHEDKGSTSIVVKDAAQSLEHVTTVPHTPEFERVQPTEDRGDLPTGEDPTRAYGQQLIGYRGTDEMEGITEPSWRSKTFYRWSQPGLDS